MRTNNATNITLQGYTDTCLRAYDPVACSRDITESVLALITIVGCLYKLFKLHYAKHKLLNQYFIFYGAILEILLLLLNWIYVHHASLDLIAELLKLFQFLVICRFYCEVASRISKTEHLYKRVCIPFLLVTSAYYVILIIVSISRMTPDKECNEPEWIQLSCSEVLLGIIFAVVGIYITNHINNVKTDSSYKKNIRLSLWGIILSFEFSSLVSAAYDILMLVYGEMNKCRGIFVENPALFTTFHIFVKFSKWLLPIWAMTLIFKPETFGTKNNNNDEEEGHDEPPMIRNSLITDFKSEFRPRGRSFNYKHLRDPDNEDERRLINQQNERGEEGGIAGGPVDAGDGDTPRRKRNKNKSRNSDSKGSNKSVRSSKDRNKNVGINSSMADVEPVVKV